MDDPATTGVNEVGNYSFFGVAPGDYYVGEVQRNGWIQTTPPIAIEFEPPARQRIGDRVPADMLLLDVDGDGASDVVATRQGQVVVSYNDGLGNFAAPVSYATLTNPGELAAADLNGDGKTDLVVAFGSGIDYRVAVLLNTGPRTYSAPSSFAFSDRFASSLSHCRR